MSGKSPRDVVRGMLPSHVEFGSEGVHTRPLTEQTLLRKPLREDYGAHTVGGPSDFGADGSQNWPGAQGVGGVDTTPLEESFRQTAGALNEYASGGLQDDKAIELFNMLVRTGLIEYMNDDIRNTAQSLARAGYVTTRMSEAEQFRRDVGGQDAQSGTPNIQVSSGAPMYQQNKGGAKVSTVSDIGSQKAQGGPAQVPKPPTGQVTSQGHDTFPDSGGTKQNPAKIKNPPSGPVTSQGHDTFPHATTGKIGGSKKIEVARTVQSDDPDADTDGDYEGSKVGSVNESIVQASPQEAAAARSDIRSNKGVPLGDTGFEVGQKVVIDGQPWLVMDWQAGGNRWKAEEDYTLNLVSPDFQVLYRNANPSEVQPVFQEAEEDDPRQQRKRRRERRVPGNTCPVLPPNFEDDIYGNSQPDQQPQRPARQRQ